MLRKSMSLILLVFLLSAMLYGIEDARLLRQPDIHGEKIVFVYGGDLWSVSLSQERAVRLTTYTGSENRPHFSPNGEWIAFSGSYDGNTDVYIIPATGGEPRRLTFHPGRDSVTGWSRDGKSVFFSSSRLSYTRRLARMFSVSINGGMPVDLPLPAAADGEVSPDSRLLAYNPFSSAFKTWRNYRGGLVSSINVYDFSSKAIKKIPHTNCNDAFPEWIGNSVYFLSDRDRVMNIYSYPLSGEEVTQVTKFKGADIKSFGTDGKTIVFEREGFLHILHPFMNEAKKLTINVPTENLNSRQRIKSPESWLITSAHISPTGKRAVFEVRGELVTVPAEKGDIRNITNTTDKAERTPAWSPDGKKIAYFGEHNGEYALQIVDQRGEKKPDIITFETPRYFKKIEWSPDSKKLLFTDQREELYYIDLEKKEPVKIDGEYYFSGFPADTLNTSWSPDSRWIAYSKITKKFFRDFYLYSIKDNKSYRITDGMAEVTSPVFDKNGKYLYFAASTDKALDTGSDMSELPHNPTSSLYALVLSADEPSPFEPESDEEEAKAAKDEKKNDKADKDKKNKDKVTKIDIKNIGRRIVPVNVPSGEISSLQAGKDKLYYLVFHRKKFSADLHMYDMKKRKDEVIASAINGYEISADGKKLLYSQKRKFFITNVGAKVKPGDGMLKTSSIEILIDPKAEWAQMLYEAWRIQRDFFYDPGMHGRDWDAVWKQYKQYLPFISHRSDLNYVIGMLIGELTIGHAYVGGGDIARYERVPGGLLGADYEIVDGFYRFKKIYYGENWNPKLKSPLTGPGINIKEGDYLVEVNGIPLKAPVNVYSLFRKTSGKQTMIKVNSEPALEGAKVCTVIPVPFEANLRHRQWIEENRRKVEKLSNGKIGYVYIPNTSTAGFHYFQRYFFAHVDKQGIIMDERFNGGGYPADYIIDHITRPLLNMVKYRTHPSVPMPTAAVYGPKVMLINEQAGSGGDIMPLYFRKRGLGKLIGKRTWGGVVGMSGYPRLLDGGFVSSPTMAIVTEEEGFDVENYGVAPDIEVEITPADFIAGRDPQLEMAVKVILEELKKNPPKKFKMPPYPRNR